MAMEERDRIDIIATLHDRFNRPAEEIIRKMERMEDQAEETGDSIDELEDSIDKESRTTRENSKLLEENTKNRTRQSSAVTDQGRALAESTKNLHANTSAIQESLSPTRKSTQATKDAAKAAEALVDVTKSASEAVDDNTEGMRESRRVVQARTRAVTQARDAMGRFIKVTEDANETVRDNTRETQENTKSHEENTKQKEKDRKEWTKWDTKIRKITSSIGGRFRPIGAFFQNYFKILGVFRGLLFSDIGALIPQLVTGLVAIGGAANATLAPLGRMLGTLGQIAPLIAAFAQAQVVVKWSIKGVSDALSVLNDETATLEDLNRAQRELGDNTWEMAKAVKALQEEFKPLQRAVRETFLEGMAPAVMNLAETYMPLLRKELTRTAEIMNGELREGMKALQTPEKQGTIADVMERSSVASGLFVDIMWSLLDVFIELADAAGPAFLETLEAIDFRLDQFSTWISENKDGLTDFFLRANDTAGEFFRGIGFILVGLSGIASAAKPLEDFLYGGLVERLEAWSERMNSPEGQAEMTANYEAMIPNLEAIGNLIGSIVDGAKEIASSEYFAPLVNDLADNGIPMIVEYFKTLDETVGPPLLRISDALSEIDPDVLTSVLAPLGDALGGLASALELVVPLFNAMPEPMQKMVMYGIGLAAMGLPGIFMLLLGALKPLGKVWGAVTWAARKFAAVIVDIAQSPFGKKVGEMAKAVGRFLAPIADFMKKHLGKLGGGLIAKIFGKVAGKGILAFAGPVGVVIGVLWLLWDVISWLWNNVKPFRDFMTGVWDWIVNAWSVSIDWIVNTAVPWVVGALQSIWQTIKDVGAWIAGFYNTWIKPVLDAIIWFGKLVFVIIGTVLITPFYLLWKLLSPIIMGIVGWFRTVIPLALDWLKARWDNIVNGLGVAWQAVKMVFTMVVGAIIGAAVWLYTRISQILSAIGAAWSAAWTWMRDKVTQVWGWIKNNVINPVINWFLTYVLPMIRWVISGIVGIFNWLRDRVTAVWGWIKNNVVGPTTSWFMTYVWPTIRNVLSWLGSRFSWLRDRIANVWDAIKDKISSVYNDKIKPIFDKFKEAVSALKRSFETARDAIGKAWDDIMERAKTPIGFVIDNVYNDGIRPVWNKLSKAVGLGVTLDEVKWAKDAYDTGGYTGPGSKYQEAGIVHADEYVIKKDSQRSLRREAPGLLDALNKYGARALQGGGYASGGWVKPFQGNYSSNSPYGMRGGRLHAGMDFPTPSGTPMIAVSNGTIVGRSWNPAAGNKMSLQTDMAGIVAGYHHLSKFLAPRGANVKKGEIIARSGNTGRSSGPHLHFSIKKDGKYVNPSPYLAGSGTAGTGEGGGGWMPNPFDGMLDGLLSKLPGQGGFKDIAVSATKTLVNGAKNYVADKLNVFDDAADYAGEKISDIKGAIGTSRWTNTARKALQHTGDFSVGNLGALLRRMNQESGGNPNAINNWDSNAKRGTPSKGLMQVIGPTFSAYRDRSLSSNIYDPMANIVAAINYTKSRYRSLQSGWGRKGGYFNGGLVDHMRFMGGPVETWGNTLVGELGPEIFMPASGGPASVLGLGGPELVSFNREGAILPHQAVAALSTVNDAPAYGGDQTYEDNHYDISVSVGAGATEIDVERAVKQAIRDIERKKKERR